MCRHKFHDIFMHNVSDIDEIGFSIMAVLICIHIYMHIPKTTCFDHEIICVDTIFEMR